MTMNRDSNMEGFSMQNELTDPVTLTFEPQNSYTSRVSQGHFLHQDLTLWDHSFLSYAADKQTRLQNPAHADRHSQRG